jgi:uncharacterized cupredoxin-like copper-binding protein
MERSRLAALSVFVAIVLSACTSAAVQAPSAERPAKSDSAALPSSQPSTPAASAAAPSSVPSGSPAVVLSEWKVTAPSTIKASIVTLGITNRGVAQHELLVFKSDLAPSAYPLDSSGDIQEDASQVNLVSDGENIDSGGSQSRTVDLSTPGTYLFVCNIPGHFHQGMYSVVTVTP